MIDRPYLHESGCDENLEEFKKVLAEPDRESSLPSTQELHELIVTTTVV